MGHDILRARAFAPRPGYGVWQDGNDIIHSSGRGYCSGQAGFDTIHAGIGSSKTLDGGDDLVGRDDFNLLYGEAGNVLPAVGPAGHYSGSSDNDTMRSSTLGPRGIIGGDDVDWLEARGHDGAHDITLSTGSARSSGNFILRPDPS